MNSIETQKKDNRFYKLLVLFSLIPFLLWAVVTSGGNAVLNKQMSYGNFGVTRFDTFEFFSILGYSIETSISLILGSILASLIKGKQAENDIDRKSISRKKIYAVYFLSIVYSIATISFHVFSFYFLLHSIFLYSALLTRMLIVNIKDKHKDRGLKAFIIANILFIFGVYIGIVVFYYNTPAL